MFPRLTVASIAGVPAATLMGLAPRLAGHLPGG